jgi:hypothetical protein
MRTTIPVYKKVTIVLSKLYYARSTYRSGMHLGISPSTKSMFTNEICKVLVIHFYDKYIQISKSYHVLQGIRASFENHITISYLWGAIGGIHICPKNQVKLANYYNRLQFHSILLQGVCDHDQKL